MKARLILWLLQHLSSRRGRSLLVALAILLLVPFVLITSVVPLTIPLVSDEQMAMYKDVAAEMPEGVVVDWRHILVIDAVRNRQDFSEVTLETIQETAGAFMACEMLTHMDKHPIDFEANTPGAFYQYWFELDEPAEVWWQVVPIQGAASIQLKNAQGQPISGGQLQAGSYSLLIVPTQLPTKYHVDLFVLTNEQVCHGKDPTQVMAELGFTDEERELAYVFINTLADVA